MEDFLSFKVREKITTNVRKSSNRATNDNLLRHSQKINLSAVHKSLSFELKCNNQFSVIEATEPDASDELVEEYNEKVKRNETKHRTLSNPKSNAKVKSMNHTEESYKKTSNNKIENEQDWTEPRVETSHQHNSEKREKKVQHSECISPDMKRCSLCFVTHFPFKRFCNWAFHHNPHKMHQT